MSVIVPHLHGGLGNQLFQIAHAYALARQLGCDWGIVDGQFAGCRQGSHPSKYYENLYRNVPRVTLTGPTADVHEKQWTWYDTIDEVASHVDQGKHVRLHGYWQSERYFPVFRNELRNLFPINLSLAYAYLDTKDAELRQDCFIGVRRGDYVQFADFHNPCGMAYYRRAMELMVSPRYVIGTDDEEWCREHFIGDNFLYLSDFGGDHIHHFNLARCFSKYIISNSTFFWWSSYLSTAGNVRMIAPDKWIHGPAAKWEDYFSIYRDDMQVIERPIEVN